MRGGSALLFWTWTTLAGALVAGEAVSSRPPGAEIVAEAGFLYGAPLRSTAPPSPPAADPVPKLRGRTKVAAVLTATALGVAGVSQKLEGPIAAHVLRVIDGDTIEVRARIWINQDLTTHVRLDGIDAPELRGSCERERDLARAARDFLAARIEHRGVKLRDVGFDKYGARVVARVEDLDGGDLAAALLAARLAERYDGGARGSWCSP